MGTRFPQFTPPFLCEDHPHACGDKKLNEVIASTNGGSSPRVWGQVYEAQDNAINYRIIPTRVGTSIYRVQVGAYEKDHPHACGDKGGVIR